MKSLFLVLLIVCICSHGLGFNLRKVKRSFTCVPGENYKEDCNTCVCDASGQQGICTRKICVDVDPTEKRQKRDLDVKLEYECEPRSSFKDDCNLCICSETGEYAICTATACVPGLDFGARFNKVTPK